MQHQANLNSFNNNKRNKVTFPKGVSTPVEHVRNQFKHALGEMIEIMRDESFAVPDYDQKHPRMSSENSFQFYCADFIFDKELDVWFIEQLFIFVIVFPVELCCAVTALIRFVAVSIEFSPIIL